MTTKISCFKKNHKSTASSKKYMNLLKNNSLHLVQISVSQNYGIRLNIQSNFIILTCGYGEHMALRGAANSTEAGGKLSVLELYQL